MTNSVEQGSCWKSEIGSGFVSKPPHLKRPNLCWNNHPLAPLPNHFFRVNVLTFYSFKINFNIILLPAFRISNGLFPSSVLTKMSHITSIGKIFSFISFILSVPKTFPGGSFRRFFFFFLLFFNFLSWLCFLCYDLLLTKGINFHLSFVFNKIKCVLHIHAIRGDLFKLLTNCISVSHTRCCLTRRPTDGNSR